MKEFFQELFEYNHFCNQQLCSIFVERQEQTSQKAIELFSHVLNAHHVWNCRIDLQPILYKAWDLQSPEYIVNLDQNNTTQSMAILQNSDLHQIIHYKNFAGEAHSKRVQDILFHIINHSTYHRAQIATEFKRAGLQPIVSDYIFYKKDA